MTAKKIKRVGLVAHYSKQGDWAFNKAFKFARERELQLNIFYFINSSFEIPQNKAPKEITTVPISEDTLIAEDRKLREYYDDLLGDYVDVGFRVCDSVRHNFELRCCLMKRDYDILFIPYIYESVPFGNMPIEEFAYRFPAPVVLVGPESENNFHINPPTNLIIDFLDLEDISCAFIEKPERYQELPVL